jgi:ABC-type glutathione transport system ATPase component
LTLVSAEQLSLHRADCWQLRGISFEVQPGEAWGIVGESGAGKTTLMNLILGLMEPTAGRVLLSGEAWSGLPEKVRRPRRPSIQALFQDPLASLPPHLTGFEILEEPLAIHGRGDRKARRQAATMMAARVCFPKSALDQKPRQWSGGLAQRLALARALMLSPGILVLDEPLSALDPTLAAHMLELLLELKAEGMAILFVSHDLLSVNRLCDKLLVLCGGETMATGPTKKMFSELRHPYMRGLWEAVPNLEFNSQLRRWGAEGTRDQESGACLLLGRCPRASDQCKTAPKLDLDERCHHPWDARDS